MDPQFGTKSEVTKKKRLGAAVYVLPNLLTTGNLFFGFLSIIKAIQGDFYWASSAILLAAVFDVLDGRVARLTGGVSEFGVQYDSLCDVVSFGVAPAFLLFYFGLEDMNRIGWITCFLFLACGALRLARFNVQSAIGNSHGDFTGLPIPMAAFIVSTFVGTMAEMRDSWDPLSGTVMFWLHDLAKNRVFVNWVMAVGAIFLAAAMVSNVAYRSHKVIHVSLVKPFQLLVIGILSLGLVAYDPMKTGFILSFAYALSGPIEYLVGWKKLVDEDEIFTPLKDEEPSFEPKG